MRLYTDQCLVVGESVALPPELAHRLQKVMRVRIGEAITLFNGNGGEYLGELITLSKKTVSVKINEFVDCNRESSLAINLIQGISRGSRMDYTIQKSVELGVHAIIPVETTRSMVKLDDNRRDNRHAHWLGVIHHACEQSGRTKIPKLFPAMPLSDIASLDNIQCSFLLDTQSQSALSAAQKPNGKSYIIAGPEGGFSDAERQWIRTLGTTSIKLGPRILRTETAALAALSIMQQRWGDW